MDEYNLNTRKNGEYNPFVINERTLDSILSVPEVYLIDSNLIIENDSEMAGRYRDSQKKEIDLKSLNRLLTDDCTFMSGANLSEVVSAFQRTDQKLYNNLVRDLSEGKSNKIINLYDKRLPITSQIVDPATKQRNVLDILQEEYGDPYLMNIYRKSRMYDEAVKDFAESSTEQEKDSAIFKYFMAFATDVSSNVNCTGKEHPENILFDAYTFAMGLAFSYKLNQTESSTPIYIASNDEDIGNISLGVEKAICDICISGRKHRPYNFNEEMTNSKEKELIGYLDSAIDNVCIESKTQYINDLRRKKTKKVA